MAHMVPGKENDKGDRTMKTNVPTTHAKIDTTVAAVRQAMTQLPMGTDASNVAVRAVRILAEMSH